MIDRLFWVDLETTGLNPSADRILEVAVLVTNRDLDVIDESHFVVYQPPEVLALMNEYVTQMHGSSGLTAECERSQVTESHVDDVLVQMVDDHYAAIDKVVLAGSSVHFDKRFIEAAFPKFAARLHYRIVDVSSFMEVFNRVLGHRGRRHEHAVKHRAMPDIQSSLEDLKHYVGLVSRDRVQKASALTEF